MSRADAILALILSPFFLGVVLLIACALFWTFHRERIAAESAQENPYLDPWTRSNRAPGQIGDRQ